VVQPDQSQTPFGTTVTGVKWPEKAKSLKNAQYGQHMS